MITTRIGNLLDATGIIVHGCNSHGIMGSGVANQIKYKWPEVYEHYNHRYLSQGLPMGSINYVRVDPKVLVVNAITQKDYGKTDKLYVSYDAIEAAFIRINDLMMKEAQYKIPKVVSFPLIGCGLANGDWDIVSKIIDTALDDSISKVLWMQQP